MKYFRDYLPEKGICFVLMPFSRTSGEQKLNWDELYERAIANTIRRTGMTPIKLNDMYGTGQLMDHTWKSIQRAEIVIADLTGRDPSVLYSLALAHVINKSVILLAMDDCEVPVDLMSYNILRYKSDQFSLFDLADQLEKAIKDTRNQTAAAEWTFVPLFGEDTTGGEPLEAQIISVAKQVVVVQQGSKQGILNPENYSWSKRNVDLTTVCEIGKTIRGWFYSGQNKELKFTCIDLKQNPWRRLETNFPINEEKTGTIVGVIPAGVFIRLDNEFKIDGFIRKDSMPRDVILERGDEIVFKTVNIDQSARMINLAYVRKMTSKDRYSIGQQFEGKIINANYEKGFVQVEFDEGMRPGALDFNHMSANLQQQFRKGELLIPLNIKVEIISRNKLDNKTWFREVS